MRVELVQAAASVLFDVPDEMHAEIMALIDAVTEDAKMQAPDLAAAFGEWCWLVYTVHGEVIEVLDVGCAQ
ncbi:hypothetical protein [Streptomyces hyaluromycini]|uniref:hypothetical protein n=1 Tax=Streptomyces hyaluromycini TaxID=1377993 RepID=UPI000B5CE735|nr:hypothetical protein [Streptomyces hyaluromycini]